MTTKDLRPEAIAPTPEIPDYPQLHCTLALGTWEMTGEPPFEDVPQHGPPKPHMLSTIAGREGFVRPAPDGGWYLQIPLQS